jgi:uncharacterized membrane protein YgdD (TMEM256/DUF423 family)
VIELCAGILVGSFPGLLISIDGIRKYGWDGPFGLMVVGWTVLAIATVGATLP